MTGMTLLIQPVNRAQMKILLSAAQAFTPGIRDAPHALFSPLQGLAGRGGRPCERGCQSAEGIGPPRRKRLGYLKQPGLSLITLVLGLCSCSGQDKGAN